MYFDFGDFLMGTILVIFFSALAIGAVVVGVEGVAAYRAREAVFACEAGNKEAVRQLFSTKVACRPRNLGADTLTVHTQ